jgi:hypothetical protein
LERSAQPEGGQHHQAAYLLIPHCLDDVPDRVGDDGPFEGCLGPEGDDDRVSAGNSRRDGVAVCSYLSGD